MKYYFSISQRFPNYITRSLLTQHISIARGIKVNRPLPSRGIFQGRTELQNSVLCGAGTQSHTHILKYCKSVYKFRTIFIFDFLYN